MSVETISKPEEVKSMYGKVDKKHLFDRETGEYKGEKIASSYPAYMHKVQTEKLAQSIDEKEAALNDNQVSSSALEYTRRQLKKEKQRLYDINHSHEEFTPVELDGIRSSFQQLEEEVARALHTEIEMETMRGIDPAEEARRMSEPCVKVDRLLAKRCNIDVEANGKISRSKAESILKMAHFRLTGGDEPYLIEALRSKKGGSKKSPQITVPIDLKGMEERKKHITELEAKIKYLEEQERIEEEKANNMRTSEVQQKIEEDAQKEDEGIDINPKMYTCPDCGETMHAKGEGIHRSRWCKAKEKKEV